MLVRMRTRCLLAALVAMTVAAGCSGSDDGSAVATSAVVLGAEPSSTTTVADPDESTPPPSQATTVAEPDPLEPELNPEPALASIEAFLDSWAAVAAGLPESPDLAPTISAADVAPDETIGVDVFVEQATPRTVIGGIVDPATGTVTGLMGLTEPDGEDTFAMLDIIWVGAFGVDDRSMMGELFPTEEIQALQIGEQMTRIHRGRSVVLNHTDGADPEDGIFVFTVGDEQLAEDDPSHDSITNVVLGLLVRTS